MVSTTGDLCVKIAVRMRDEINKRTERQMLDMLSVGGLADGSPPKRAKPSGMAARLAAPDEDDSEMFAWIDFGHGVTRQETWFGSHSRDSVWVATQGIPLLRELITDAQLEIGRRGTR